MKKPTMWEQSRVYYRNRAHRGAYRKGALAFWKGKHEDENPYDPRASAGVPPTWSAGYYWAWRAGFNHAEAGEIVLG